MSSSHRQKDSSPVKITLLGNRSRSLSYQVTLHEHHMQEKGLKEPGSSTSLQYQRPDTGLLSPRI